jgi:4'-phosphopantetheinyl transferase
MNPQQVQPCTHSTTPFPDDRGVRQENWVSEEDGFECVVARLDTGPDGVESAKDSLSDDERVRANRFIFERDRNRYIVARGELRRLLGQRMRMPPEDIEFRYGAHGKPEIQNGLSKEDLRFNVSHCEDVAIYGFTRGRRIGIDVEAIRHLPDADDVAARCFSARELEDYRALDSSEKHTGFFNCWTRKEAFVKAVGEGLGYSLGDFDVSLVPGEPARILRVGSSTKDTCGWKLRDIRLVPGFAAALVIESSTN